MSSQVHYEIFVRRKAGGWSLHEALSDRDEAKRGAKSLLGSSGIVEVKVVKETLNTEGTFQSVSIFEDGEKEKKTAVETNNAIPCFKPQDLHGPHARATIARVLKSYLLEWRVTPMELIHSGDLLEKLEARSTTLQGAVQQVAVAMASSTETSVQTIYRQLIDLCLRAMDRVVQDERKGRFQPLPSPSLVAYFDAVPQGGDAPYLLSGAIAKYLRPMTDPSDKLAALVGLLTTLPEPDGTRETAAATVDAFIAEIVRAPTAMAKLVGKNAETGEVLRIFVDLFLGRADNLTGDAAAMRDLAAALKNDLLPATMAALSEILVTEIKSQKRLHPSSFQSEIETIRHLAQQLVYGVGKHLSIDDLTEAFLIRSRRLVTPEAIEAYLKGTEATDERIAKLIALEENVVGAQSKTALAAFIHPLVASVRFESTMTDDRVPIAQRLKRLTQLQRETADAGFEEKDTAEIVDALGRLADKAEERAHLLRSIDMKRMPSADKAMSIMRLRESGVLPDGSCWSRGREMVRALIRKPDFADSLCPDSLGRDQHIARREEFRRLFDSLGVGSPKHAPPAQNTAA